MLAGIVVSPADFVGVDWPVLAKRYGIDIIGLHSGGGAAHDVVAALGDFAGTPFRERCDAAGVRLEYEEHASHELLDRGLFADHPEYFPLDMRTGRRVAGGNWCVSNPAALAQVAANSVKLAAKLPTSTGRYFFWGEDTVAGGWCHCEDCRGLTTSDQSLAGANAMAGALRAADTSARAAYLAYYSTLTTPRAARPAEGVFLEYAPLGRCYRHALDDDSCAVNRPFRARLDELLTVFPAATAHILEYWLDISYFSDYAEPAVDTPVPAAVMRRDIAFYRGLGVESATTFAVRMDGGYFARFGEAKLAEYAAAFRD